MFRHFSELNYEEKVVVVKDLFELRLPMTKEETKFWIEHKKKR
jgi:hypothetical protein